MGVYNKVKRARDADEEKARDIRRAKRASIRLGMVRQVYAIVDYSDSSDFSDEATINDDSNATNA
jgi:hypothetical protein